VNQIHKINSNEISADIVKRISEGDVSAFKLIFTSYWNPLLNFANRIVKDEAQSENIVQDTFLFIWENKSRLDHEKNLKTYLFTTVRNKSLNFINSAAESKRSESDAGDIEADSTFKAMENKELREALERAVEELPVKCKEIFIMSKFSHLTYREIAEILGISIKTVETQMTRALKKLRALLAHLLTLIFFIKDL